MLKAGVLRQGVQCRLPSECGFDERSLCRMTARLCIKKKKNTPVPQEPFLVLRFTLGTLFLSGGLGSTCPSLWGRQWVADSHCSARRPGCRRRTLGVWWVEARAEGQEVTE